jgi:hypothetical protein
LSHITFNAILPEYAERYCAKLERETDQNDNNNAFSNAVAQLFDVLRSWESEGLPEMRFENSLDLTI